jgi:hypothetical protein
MLKSKERSFQIFQYISSCNAISSRTEIQVEFQPEQETDTNNKHLYRYNIFLGSK